MSDIRHRFTSHPPVSPAVSALLDSVTERMVELGEWIEGTVPPGREQALALTNLEQASFWTKAAIARSQQPPTGADRRPC